MAIAARALLGTARLRTLWDPILKPGPRGCGRTRGITYWREAPGAGARERLRLRLRGEEGEGER